MREVYHTIFIPKPENEATPTEMTVEGIVLVDLQTKREFREIIEAGHSIIADPSSWPVRYTAVYNFYGRSQFGRDVHVRATAHVTLGNFDNCD